MGYQYAIRLDHLQWVLGRAPGPGAAYTNWISESAARDVVKRWEQGKWVQHGSIRAHEPFWVWPTRLGLRKVGLPYSYRNVEKTSLEELNHLSAINEIRLHLDEDEGGHWISERQLLQAGFPEKGQKLLHRPDGEVHCANGDIIAIEAELSEKKPRELPEILLELVRGQEYVFLKSRYAVPMARIMSEGMQSRYSQIWYFAPKTIRRHVQQARAELVNLGDLSQQEARRLYIYWYPLVRTDAEERQEAEEEQQARHLYR